MSRRPKPIQIPKHKPRDHSADKWLDNLTDAGASPPVGVAVETFQPRNKRSDQYLEYPLPVIRAALRGNRLPPGVDRKDVLGSFKAWLAVYEPGGETFRKPLGLSRRAWARHWDEAHAMFEDTMRTAGALAYAELKEEQGDDFKEPVREGPLGLW